MIRKSWPCFIICVMVMGGLLYGSDIMVLDYHFASPTLHKRTDGFIDISVKGMHAVTEQGYPMLPSYPALVLLPDGFDVDSVKIKTSDDVLLGRGIEVNYFRGNFPTVKTIGQPIQPAAEIYNSSTPFPPERVQYGRTYHLKGYRIVPITLHPFRYLPDEGALYFSQNIILSICLSRSGNEKSRSMMRPSSEDRRHVAGLVDNPEYVESYEIPSGMQKDIDWEYLIITSNTVSGLWDAFQVLATHKLNKGLTVHMEDIGAVLAGQPGVDDAEKLRNFIIDAYLNHGTQWVVLGGDSEIIPWRGCYGKVGTTTDNNIPCDFYFAALDGDWNANENSLYGELDDDVDLFADVDVGRISASNSTEADRQITKIISYENSSPPFSALLLGENLDSRPTWGGDAKDVVEEEMGGIPTQKLYDKNGTWSKSTLINDYLNTNDTHIVNHLGHASDTYDMKMYNSDVASLTNTAPFFVYTQGCIPGNFPQNDRCFAEEITLNTTSGAFAVIMNSRYGWYEPGGTSGASNVFDWEFMESVFEQFRTNLGAALNDSRHKLAGYAEDGVMRWVYFEMILFGCPETAFHWDCTAGSVRMVPDFPGDEFIVMQNDAVPLQVAAHTDCAGPIPGAVITADVSYGKSTRETLTLLDDGVAPDMEAGDGLFTAEWTPTDVGAATITYDGSGTGLAPAQVILQGDVVEEMHYHLVTPSFDWIDASSGTTVLAGEDDAGEVVDFGFTFKFYGKAYDSVMISSNGLLRFTDTYTHEAANFPIPMTDDPNAIIAPFWTDLNPASGGHVYYLTTGTAPNRQFVVEWFDVPHFDNVGAATFEVILEESTHNITMLYQDTDFGNGDYDHGADATAGIEDYNGRKGIQYSYATPDLTDGLAVLYTPIDGPSVQVSHHEFNGGNGDDVLDPGETLNVDVTLYNAGNEPARDVTATVTADNGVTFSVGTQSYGDIIVEGSGMQAFTFTVPSDIDCGQAIQFSVDIQYTDDEAGNFQSYGSFVEHVGTLVDVVTFDDDMESGLGAWTTELASGVTDWTQVTDQAHSPSTSWFTPDESSIKDNSLVSEMIEVPFNGELSFWHDFDLENSYDGGVLEVRPDGGDWTDLGSAMIQGDYTGTLSTYYNNPLGGREAWEGDGGGFLQTVVDLTDYVGQNVQFRFRLGCDSSVSDNGWWIDDVVVSGSYFECPENPATGDVNKSGNVDAADLAIVLNVTTANIAEGAPPCTAPEMGDFNGNNSIDADDCVTLAYMLCGNL